MQLIGVEKNNVLIMTFEDWKSAFFHLLSAQKTRYTPSLKILKEPLSAS